MSAPPSSRTLGPSDEFALESHLTRHWSTSIPIRANARAGGLSDEGELNQGTYAALLEGSTIIALAVHYRDGALMVQAPRAIGQVVRAAVGESQRVVERIVGPWTQVNLAAAALGADPKEPYLGRAQTLATLDVAKLQVDAARRPDAKPRLATPADAPTLSQWRTTYLAQLTGTAPADNASAANETVARDIAAQDLYVAEAGGKPVAMASCEARVTDAVQIGAVWSPAALKDKLYTPVAILGVVQAAKEHGAKRVVLLTNKTDAKAATVTRAMGFVAMDEFGTLHVPH